MEPTGTSAPARNCLCHDERMFFKRDSRYRIGGYYLCAEGERARHRARYDALTGLAYNLLLMRHRRHKALAARNRRASTSVTGGGI